MIENSQPSKVVDLTSDQVKAKKLFTSWLEKKNCSEPFILQGYAGTGKTFLSTKLLSEVDSYGLCWTVVAPTHKAVGVIRDVLNNEGLRPTWFPSTIHRLLRLKLKRKAEKELCERTEQTANSLEQLDIVLIDEASMIDSNLLEITLQCAHPFKTRLIFVGDPAQLPPIGEIKSPIFEMKRASIASLNEVVRHQGSVLKLASLVRDGQFTSNCPPCFNPIRNKESLVGSMDKRSWMSHAQSRLKAAATNGNPDAARILCFTNKSLERLVPHARRAIHGEMADQLPVLPGEVLISRTAVMAPASLNGSDDGEEPDMVLGSNRELIVNDVKPEIFDLSEYGLKSNNNFSVPLIDTLLANVRAGESELTLRLLPPIGTEARKLLDETLQKLKAHANEVGKTNARSIWRQFFFIRDAFASVGPAAVLTIHRSQGSTFEEVFVDSDVFWAKDKTLRKQLIYVAVSRAKKAVWLVGNTQTGLKSDSLEKSLKGL